MKEITKYIADDGKVFDSKTECEEYEKTIAPEYELTFSVNAILRLDDIIVTRKIKTNAKPSFDYESVFRDLAFDAINNTDNYETAGELLAIAARQNIYPYFEGFDDTVLTEYKKIK